VCRTGGAESEIRSHPSLGTVRAAEGWKFALTNSRQRSRTDDLFPTRQLLLCLKSHNGSSRNDHLRNSDFVNVALLWEAFLSGTDLTIMPVWHSSRRTGLGFEAWHSPTPRKPSFCSQRCAWQTRVVCQPCLGGVDITLSRKSSRHESRLYGMAWHTLTMQIIPSRSAMPGTVMPHADRSVSSRKSDALVLEAPPQRVP
jgi:hypothetical protein